MVIDENGAHFEDFYELTWDIMG